ncbi:MAG: c-type cytochrome, partial [Planctomycetales bacterium]|nr:c-type cytochrome [Planctomycetales bacterium]
VLVKNLAFTFKDRPADHTSNGVTLGIDGWLYLAIGDFGFMEAEGADGRKLQMRGGGVVRVRPDGTELQTYSRGTRNILEVAVDPLLNGFTRDNTNDGGGWDIRLHHFTGLEHHGYPSLYMNFGDEIVQPLADYGGGSGCGALFMDEPGFPAGYGRALYTADWGRSWVYRHPLKPNGATFEPEQHEFAGLPRVTDLDVDAMSGILLTSWKGATFTYAGEEVGYVVRVTPKGYQPEPLPDFAAASDLELIELLKSPSHRRRMEAQRTLVRRGLNEATAQQIEKLAADASQPIASRVAAVFALKQALGSQANSALLQLASDATIRAFAIRALADRGDQLGGVDIALLANGLSDKNARTRLEAVVALARFGGPDAEHANSSVHDQARLQAAEALAASLDESDPVIAHTIVQALIALRAGEALLPIEAAVGDSEVERARRSRALRALQSIHEPEVVDALIARLAAETIPERRQGLFTALCRLHYVDGPWKGNSWGTRPDTSGPYYQPEAWAASPRIAAALKAALEQASGDQAATLLNTLARHKVQLDGTLDRLITIAAKDASVLPIAVAEIGRAARVAPEAAELLERVARDAKAQRELRLAAAATLLKSDHPDAFATALQTLADSDEQDGNKHRTNELWNALRNAKQLPLQAEALNAQATKARGAASLWADAALLSLATRKQLAPETRELVERSLADGWADPARATQLLEAAMATNQRDYEPQVRRSLASSDKAVATMARRVADAWKLPPEPTPAGPPISTMKPEDVIAAVLKRQGDIARGEQLFGKLNCAKCHTVKQGEPLRGPFLPQVAKTYKREQLAEAVLLPSKSIAQGFVTNAFLLDSGKVVTGFVTNE